MISAHWTALPVLLFAGQPPAPGPEVKGADANVWQTVPLVQAADVVVRAKVKRRASLADVGWMVLEFETQGKFPWTVKNASYRIESERDNLATGQRVSSGSLSSGNTFDLFPDAWKTRPVSPIILKPGETYRVVDQASDYSAALLALPPQGGLRVRAQVHLRLELELKDRLVLATPNGGVPITFEWHYPDEAGFQAMRTRLQKLLQTPENRPYHTYLLQTHLKVPEVAKAATRDELLKAVASRRNPFEGRAAVVANLAARFPGDREVVAWYRDQLQAGDAEAVRDVRIVGLWDKSLVESVLRLYEKDPIKYGEALNTLDRHHADWGADAKVVARLSAAVRKAHPLLQRKVSDLKGDALAHWAGDVRALAMTRDRDAIELLRPALDDRRAFRRSGDFAFFPTAPPHPLRVCDCALDAILTLLDSSPAEAYRGAGLDQFNLRTGDDLDKALAERRDTMIAELKQRLAERDKHK